jgi:hypothetical protein
VSIEFRGSHGRPRSSQPSKDDQFSCLLDHIRANLADQRILITGTSAAPDCADELAAFDQWEAARRGNEGAVKGRDVGVAGFVSIVEQLRGAAVARGGARSRLIDAYWNHLPGCVEAPAAS